ncbi:hypothetical protein PMAYCL1PPCAC_22058, partial [Pristionchus mayeri]
FSSSYYFPTCEECVNIFIALNRLSAFAMYNQYEKVWSHIFWLCLPAIFGLPFLSYYHLLDTKTYFVPLFNGTMFMIDYDHSVRPWRSNRSSSFYLYLVCSITALTINLTTIVVIFTHKELITSILEPYFETKSMFFQALSPGIMSLILSTAIRNELVRGLR